ncbi:MAG: hypothetical protein J6V53_05825 [Alphaproteobacteria bacterium]|nr:hypothetical protein [Alphaproteobacteria bacterium]
MDRVKLNQFLDCYDLTGLTRAEIMDFRRLVRQTVNDFPFLETIVDDVIQFRETNTPSEPLVRLYIAGNLEDGVAGLYSSGTGERNLYIRRECWDRYVLQNNFNELGSIFWHETMHLTQDYNLNFRIADSACRYFIVDQYREAEAKSIDLMMRPRDNFSRTLYQICDQRHNIEDYMNREEVTRRMWFRRRGEAERLRRMDVQRDFIGAATRERLCCNRDLALFDRVRQTGEQINFDDWSNAEMLVERWRRYYLKQSNIFNHVLNYTIPRRGDNDGLAFDLTELYHNNRYGQPISVQTALTNTAIRTYGLPFGMDETVITETSLFDSNRWHASMMGRYYLELPRMDFEGTRQLQATLATRSISSRIAIIQNGQPVSSFGLLLDENQNEAFMRACNELSNFTANQRLHNDRMQVYGYGQSFRRLSISNSFKVDLDEPQLLYVRGDQQNLIDLRSFLTPENKQALLQGMSIPVVNGRGMNQGYLWSDAIGGVRYVDNTDGGVIVAQRTLTNQDREFGYNQRLQNNDVVPIDINRAPRLIFGGSDTKSIDLSSVLVPNTIEALNDGKYIVLAADMHGEYPQELLPLFQERRIIVGKLRNTGADPSNVLGYLFRNEQGQICLRNSSVEGITLLKGNQFVMDYPQPTVVTKPAIFTLTGVSHLQNNQVFVNSMAHRLSQSVSPQSLNTHGSTRTESQVIYSNPTRTPIGRGRPILRGALRTAAVLGAASGPLVLLDKEMAQGLSSSDYYSLFDMMGYASIYGVPEMIQGARELYVHGQEFWDNREALFHDTVRLGVANTVISGQRFCNNLIGTTTYDAMIGHESYQNMAVSYRADIGEQGLVNAEQQSYRWSFDPLGDTSGVSAEGMGTNPEQQLSGRTGILRIYSSIPGRMAGVSNHESDQGEIEEGRAEKLEATYIVKNGHVIARINVSPNGMISTYYYDDNQRSTSLIRTSRTHENLVMSVEARNELEALWGKPLGTAVLSEIDCGQRTHVRRVSPPRVYLTEIPDLSVESEEYVFKQREEFRIETEYYNTGSVRSTYETQEVRCTSSVTLSRNVLDDMLESEGITRAEFEAELRETGRMPAGLLQVARRQELNRENTMIASGARVYRPAEWMEISEVDSPGGNTNEPVFQHERARRNSPEYAILSNPYLAQEYGTYLSSDTNYLTGLRTEYSPEGHPLRTVAFNTENGMGNGQKQEGVVEYVYVEDRQENGQAKRRLACQLHYNAEGLLVGIQEPTERGTLFGLDCLQENEQGQIIYQAENGEKVDVTSYINVEGRAENAQGHQYLTAARRKNDIGLHSRMPYIGIETMEFDEQSVEFSPCEMIRIQQTRKVENETQYQVYWADGKLVSGLRVDEETGAVAIYDSMGRLVMVDTAKNPEEKTQDWMDNPQSERLQRIVRASAVAQYKVLRQTNPCEFERVMVQWSEMTDEAVSLEPNPQLTSLVRDAFMELYCQERVRYGEEGIVVDMNQDVLETQAEWATRSVATAQSFHPVGECTAPELTPGMTLDGAPQLPPESTVNFQSEEGCLGVLRTVSEQGVGELQNGELSILAESNERR